jgi:ApbE family
MHTFTKTVMGLPFTIKLPLEDSVYAAQAAEAAFTVVEQLEGIFSCHRESSEINAIARLGAGELLRISQPLFKCLVIARELATQTGGLFSITQSHPVKNEPAPSWHLDPAVRSFVSETGNIKLELEWITHGFALDAIAEELYQWECPHFLLEAGGVFRAGSALPPDPGWQVALATGPQAARVWLQEKALGCVGRLWVLVTGAARAQALAHVAAHLPKAEFSIQVSRWKNCALFQQERGRWQMLGTGPVHWVQCTGPSVFRWPWKWGSQGP